MNNYIRLWYDYIYKALQHYFYETKHRLKFLVSFEKIQDVVLYSKHGIIIMTVIFH